jgi:hypothetical protein
MIQDEGVAMSQAVPLGWVHVLEIVEKQPKRVMSLSTIRL